MFVAVLQIVMEVLVAALAVVGAYTILRESILGVVASRQVRVAVVLQEAVDEVSLDILLDEALRHPCRRRGGRIVLLMSRHLLAGEMGEAGVLSPSYGEIVERYHAEVFLVDALME